MKELKFLFETTIQKVVDDVSVEKTTVNGEDVEIKRTVKKLKPVKVAILKPDRRLFKSADIFYSKTLGEYLKAGLLPYSLVAKRYANDGGPLSDADKNKLIALREEANKLEGKFFSAIGSEDQISQKDKNETLMELNRINGEVNKIQNAYSDIFESTAEMKSRNETIEWWSLFLIYWNPEDKGYVPLFGDGDYENKLNHLDDIEDQNDPFLTEIIKRMSFLVSFWFTAAGSSISKIDFQAMENLFIEKNSDYKPVATETPEIVTPKVEEVS